MTVRNSMQNFGRDISYTVLKRDDGMFVLTARLQDRFHDIVAEVVVEGSTLAIAAAAVEFRKSPTRDCRTVTERLPLLIGFRVGKGLNKKLAEVFGGGEGCGNLRNLLLGLLPLAMNLRAAEGFVDDREMLDAIHERLRGTCAGYARPVAAGD